MLVILASLARIARLLGTNIHDFGPRLRRSLALILHGLANSAQASSGELKVIRLGRRVLQRPRDHRASDPHIVCRLDAANDGLRMGRVVHRLVVIRAQTVVHDGRLGHREQRYLIWRRVVVRGTSIHSRDVRQRLACAATSAPRVCVFQHIAGFSHHAGVIDALQRIEHAEHGLILRIELIRLLSLTQLLEHSEDQVVAPTLSTLAPVDGGLSCVRSDVRITCIIEVSQ